MLMLVLKRKPKVLISTLLSMRQISRFSRKSKKHGTDAKRRVWRKLHIAVATNTHEIIAAELSLSTVTDEEVLPNLLKQTRRNIFAISGNCAYDTRDLWLDRTHFYLFSVSAPIDSGRRALKHSDLYS